MIAENQGAKDDLGAGQFFALGGLGGTFETAKTILDLPTFSLKAFDFLLMGSCNLHGGNGGG